jgi:ketosteroid isomerase-like protein
MKKVILKFIVWAIFFYQSNLLAQTPIEFNYVLEGNVEAHKGLEESYLRFSKAYTGNDAETLANAYALDASYLQSDGKLIQGRDEIRKVYIDFVNMAKQQGTTRYISFRIVDRKVFKGVSYDVGYFKVKIFKDNKQTIEVNGLFTFMHRKIKGSWEIHVESYSGIKN